MRREVGAQLEVEITAPTTLEFQIAVAPHPNTEVYESLSFELDGTSVQALGDQRHARQPHSQAGRTFRQSEGRVHR